MSNPFAAPAASTGITWGDHLGKLLLIEPTALETGISTSLGEKDAVRADVHVINGPADGEVFDDCLIFPKVMIGQLRSKIGEKVLGRLGQGVAKSGQSPPWMIQEASADDVEKGVAYLEHVKKSAVSPPAATAPAAAPVTSGDVPF